MAINMGGWHIGTATAYAPGYTGVHGQQSRQFVPNWQPDPDIQLQADMALRNQEEAYNRKQLLAQQLRSSYNPVQVSLVQPTQIGTGPVWDQGQIQARVNAARASNDASTAGQISRMEGSMGARGFGAQSPLAMALQQRMQSENLASNMDVDRNIRWDAAKGNAAQMLAGQKAAADAWGQYNQAQVSAAQVAAQQQNALLAALASLIG